VDNWQTNLTRINVPLSSAVYACAVDRAGVPGGTAAVPHPSSSGTLLE